MKSYTDLEQSKRLAEILPLESADLSYKNFVPEFFEEGYCLSLTKKEEDNDIPCWSLAALIDMLESEIDGEEGETYQLNIEKDGTWWNIWYEERYDEANPIEITSTEKLIDACYEMILKLNELKLL